jgi:hypothetical protein
MSELFSGYKIFEDPDDENDLFLVTTKESIVYASFSEIKAQEAAEILDVLFEETRKDEEVTIYQLTLDDFLLNNDELDELEKLMIIEEEDD